MSNLLRITCVLAYWCPHCDPITIDILKKISDDLNVPLRLLDIDDVENIRREDISGVDPMAPWMNLGNSSGLEYSYIDTNVYNELFTLKE